MSPKQFLKWREGMGLTQAQAANLLGYKNKSMIARFEGGFAPISPRVEMLCRMFKDTN
jgi:transcriptional regulator with XRE-family HTH domain